MSLDDLAATITDSFRKVFRTLPRWIAAAPGRVNVIGEHTDYNDGFVLPMAIERYTLVAGAPTGNAIIRLLSTTTEEPALIDLNQPLKPAPKGAWFNYPLGVVAGFQARGLTPPGFNALVHSNVPLG